MHDSFSPAATPWEGGSFCLSAWWVKRAPQLDVLMVRMSHVHPRRTNTKECYGAERRHAAAAASFLPKQHRRYLLYLYNSTRSDNDDDATFHIHLWSTCRHAATNCMQIRYTMNERAHHNVYFGIASSSSSTSSSSSRAATFRFDFFLCCSCAVDDFLVFCCALCELQ